MSVSLSHSLSHAPSGVVLLNQLFHHNLSVPYLWFPFLNSDQDPDDSCDPEENGETEEVEGVGVRGILYWVPVCGERHRDGLGMVKTQLVRVLSKETVLEIQLLSIVTVLSG